MHINIYFDLQKAFAMATFPNTPIMGTRTIEDPSSEHMSAKEYVWLRRTVLNGGKAKGGSPDRTVPVQNQSTICIKTQHKEITL